MSGPTLFNRQRDLLGLLAALGGSRGATEFQKLLFLYCHERGQDAPYEFVPYKFGAFSFTSYSDKRKLVEKGLLVEEESAWRLTKEGKLLAEKWELHLRFARTHGKKSASDLVRLTYERFPYFATRSEIATDVLSGNDEALKRVRNARRVRVPRAVTTIGYEGRSLEGYLNLLIHSGTTILCDVRRNPLSRKYGFSKSALKNGCEGVDIRYEHLPELGIASEERRSLDSQADYDALFARYRKDYLPSQLSALSRLASWALEGERIALTCFELHPHQCHRHCVGEELEARYGTELSPHHL